MSSSGKRKRTHAILNRDQMNDIQNSLEHILMAGSKKQHDEMRRKIFKAQHEPLLDLEHRQTLNVPPAISFGQEEHVENNVFVEDVRIYGERNVLQSKDLTQMLPWPTLKPRIVRQTSRAAAVGDKQWDIEHGDGINLLAFTKARLSQIPPKDNERDMIDGKNLLIETTDVTTPEEHVIRALVLRCWERAVHAASCTTFANNNGIEKEHEDISASQTRRLPYDLEHEETSHSRDATEKKCRSLGVDLSARMLLQKTCPRCSVSFDDEEKLTRHYYGGTDGLRSTRGCCWGLIRERHLQFVDTSLKNHVMKQTELFLGTIMDMAKKKVGQDTSTRPQTLMNWYDILKFVETTLESSHRVEKSQNVKASHTCLESIETKSKQSPILLNPDILEAVQIRLIDRYADVPP